MFFLRQPGPDVNQVDMTDRNTPTGQPEQTDGSSDTAFDLWLNRGLHQLFDDVANEPIPDELLKLILDDQKK